MDNLMEIKKRIYQILVEFDELCKKNNFNYYICYGTLLGAVRHGDFIPWDDDIDVIMPREDYDRFIKEGHKLLRTDLVLKNYTDEEYYPINFARIVDIGTTIVAQVTKENRIVAGAYMDIFPIDGAGKTKKEAIRRLKMTYPLKAAIYLSSSTLNDKKRALWKRIAIRVAKLLNPKKLQNMLTNFVRKKAYKDNQFVGVLVDGYKDRAVMDKDVFGEAVQIKFGDHYFNAPSNADQYLKNIYGNYMELPPEENRVSLHKFIYVNMNKPFKDFDIKDLDIE